MSAKLQENVERILPHAAGAQSPHVLLISKKVGQGKPHQASSRGIRQVLDQRGPFPATIFPQLLADGEVKGWVGDLVPRVRLAWVPP